MAKGRRYKKDSHEDKIKKIIYVTAIADLIKTIIDCVTTIINKFF